MHVTEIYADRLGETHFRANPIVVAPRDFAPPSAPMGVSAETPMTTGVLLEFRLVGTPNITRRRDANGSWFFAAIFSSP